MYSYILRLHYLEKALQKYSEKKSMFEEEGIAPQWFKTHPQHLMRIYWTLIYTYYQFWGRKHTVIKNPEGTCVTPQSL